MREEAPEQPSGTEQIRACADTLECGPRCGFVNILGFRVSMFEGGGVAKRGCRFGGNFSVSDLGLRRKLRP